MARLKANVRKGSSGFNINLNISSLSGMSQRFCIKFSQLFYTLGQLILNNIKPKRERERWLKRTMEVTLSQQRVRLSRQNHSSCRKCILSQVNVSCLSSLKEKEIEATVGKEIILRFNLDFLGVSLKQKNDSLITTNQSGHREKWQENDLS